MFQEFFFFLVAATIVFSSILVVVSRNPLHSLLSLIWTFLNGAVLFLLNGAEFLAFILIIVYVGAVSVLFLFIVMMLNVNIKNRRWKNHWYFFSGGAITLIFLAEMMGILYQWTPSSKAYDLVAHPPSSLVSVAHTTNTEQLGGILYTYYFFPFQLSAIILLIAMVGAIVLTFTPPKRGKRPSIKTQLKRSGSVTLSHETEFRKGVKGGRL